MKASVVFVLILLVVIPVVVACVGISIYQDSVAEQQRLVAEQKAGAEFQRQLQNNWDVIVQAVNLLPLRLEGRGQLKKFASYSYKQLDALKFRVDPRYEGAADVFMDTVYLDAKHLFKLLSTELKSSRLDTIIDRANVLDNRMGSFQKRHPDFKRPDTMVGVVLESKLKDLVKPPVQAKAPIRVVYAYPTWVTSPVQQEAWDTMRNIAIDCFRERRSLAQRMRWDIARRDSSYLRSYNVQMVLEGAIRLRQEMISRIGNAERVEGMSALGSQLRTMLDNSITGLRYAKDGDYATFKAYNNQNDRIQADIRRTFGIR